MIRRRSTPLHGDTSAGTPPPLDVDCDSTPLAASAQPGKRYVVECCRGGGDRAVWEVIDLERKPLSRVICRTSLVDARMVADALNTPPPDGRHDKGGWSDVSGVGQEVEKALTSNDIPRPWKEVLSEMQVVWPSAVIAGGALRDLDHERGIRDVDVFVPAVAISEVERLFPDAKKIDLDDASVFGSDIPYHFTFVRYGWLFEVTFKDDIEDLLDAMDVGLCRIMYDGLVVIAASTYVRDSRRKTLTLLRRTGGEEDHIARIALKYPDFRMKIALEYDEDF